MDDMRKGKLQFRELMDGEKVTPCKFKMSISEGITIAKKGTSAGCILNPCTRR